MHPHSVLTTCDLGRIGAALYDGGDDCGVAAFARTRGDDDAIAHMEACIGGKAAVDGDRAAKMWRAAAHDRLWRPLRRCGVEGSG